MTTTVYLYCDERKMGVRIGQRAKDDTIVLWYGDVSTMQLLAEFLNSVSGLPVRTITEHEMDHFIENNNAVDISDVETS